MSYLQRPRSKDSFAPCSLFFFLQSIFKENASHFDNPLFLKSELSHFMYFSFVDAKGVTGGVL